MTSQLDIFATPRLAMPEPRSRNTDPETSAKAAQQHSTALRGQCAEVLALIQRNPGSTACELAKLWRAPMEYGLRRVAASRRTADLERRGFVRKGQKARACSVTGNSMSTWYPVG